jgi:hypothetical protein
MQLKLRGLNDKHVYVVTDLEGRVIQRDSGAKLAATGLVLDLSEPRSVAICKYRKRR